ncbi:MAG: DNA-processing protein DprA [Oscillospiraceae bacterium]|nr:DNA-processing protein DprA [Oscillospiraceae bacterium]
MNRNSEVIFMLCSHILQSADYKPYEPSEWSKLADVLMQAELQPYDLAEMSDTELNNLRLSKSEIDRIHHLLNRGGSLAFEMGKYESMGISIVTRADTNYPKKIKARLGKSCPPLFYYAGNIKLADQKCVGFAGSRNIDETDCKFTEKIVSKINTLEYAVVSGGAKGIDTISADCSIQNGSQAVVFLADSMVKQIRSKQTISAIQNNQLLLLSAVKPDMGFTAATAMMRNKYIYTQSEGTVIVRSDYKKGGTWSGATDCIRHEIAPVFCWNHPEYKGNQELIKLGAIPIDENWDGNISVVKKPKEDEFVQLSLFENT